MTEPLNENELKAEFRQLRETEMRAAPAYRESASGSAVAAPRWRMRPAVQFALLALMLVAGSVVWFDLKHDRSAPETAGMGSPPLEEVDQFAAFEMPTDFLLDTPWYDLAATTPDFEFEFPQYDIPEELSDEI